MVKVRHNPEEHDFDYTLRKTVHTKLFTETHAKLRIKAAELKLSVQEIFQCFSELLGNDDKRLLSILKEYKKKKRQKETDSLVGKADVDELYELIEDNSPLKGTLPKIEEDHE